MREEWVDRSHRPFVSGDRAWVPVREGYAADADLPERKPYSGRGYQMIGDIAVVHGAPPSKEEITALVHWKNPRAVVHCAGVRGEQRFPECRLLYGEAGEVCHRELGMTYWLDPTQVMFSMGNREEKRRMHAIISRSAKGARVADMFAGIGYFTIPAARAGARVHAIELNPIAFAYLQRNIAANGVHTRVTASLGDCRHHLNGIYDRFIMGHFDAARALPDALLHARSGSTFHVHSIAPQRESIEHTIVEAGYTCAIKEVRVKKYSPGKVHRVYDVVVA
jgi:tRNA wybutosine-synthesizing protein 2